MMVMMMIVIMMAKSLHPKIYIFEDLDNILGQVSIGVHTWS